MEKIKLDAVGKVENVISVEMLYEEFISKFGSKHYPHPKDWDAPGPVELWCYKLPWGQKIILEYLLGAGVFRIFLGILEVESILDYLQLNDYKYYIDDELINLIKKNYAEYTEGLGNYHLYRQDDNGNNICVKTFETRRVAEYYQKTYEDQGHKQIYWVEQES